MNQTLGPYQINSIITGDARKLAEAIPDASVDLIFTDPVYERIEDYFWLAQTANRVLRPDKPLLCFCGIGYQEQTQAMLRLGGRPVTWIFPVVYSAGNTPRFHPKGFAKWSMLLWCGGDPVAHFCDAQISTFENNGNSHKWTKNERPLKSYLTAFSKIGDVVYDPFTGGGTVPKLCKQYERHFFASEIEPEIAEVARRRVARQPVTPTLLPNNALAADQPSLW